MNELATAVSILGKPYTLTLSRLGAVTKVFDERYICDPAAFKELFERVAEKVAQLNPCDKAFSFLISYSDRTHHDGMVPDLAKLSTIATGKRTDRVVLKWVAKHLIDGVENELSITVRISNPINPLMFFQAALSKSPNELDNLEFELGSTCATVNGSGQMYADEVFQTIQKWIDARNKPHAFIAVHEHYDRFEWLIDQLAESFFPFLAVTLAAVHGYRNLSTPVVAAFVPVAIAGFFVLRSVGRALNGKMAQWANRSKFFSVFQLTNGDVDALAKIAATSKSSTIKLIVSGSASIALNVIAGVICYWLLKT